MLPEMVKKICDMELCDAWSVDYKGISNNIAPYIGVKADKYLKNIKKTLICIIKNKLPLEIRTTFFEGNEKDRELIKKRMIHLEQGVFKIYPDYPYFRYIEQEDMRENYKELNID